MSRKRGETAFRRGNRVVRGVVRSPLLQPVAARDGRAWVSEMQRARLLGGAVAAVEELGWANVSVASIASRARVSRKTFYDLFSDREDCLLEVCDDTLERVVAELRAAKVGDLPWLERMRVGLWVVLGFFDREPELARVCVVQSVHGGPAARAWRADLLGRLIANVDEGRLQGERAAEVPALMAEGAVGSVVMILTRLLAVTEKELLTGLLSEFTSLIVMPYIGVRRTRTLRERPVPKSPAPASVQSRAYHAGEDPLKDVPMRLTYRTARVLEAVVQHPGASNRLIGELAGIDDQGQISKLLGRLERLGLLANSGAGHANGEPNAWRLTELGQRITQSIRTDDHGSTA